jgi:hypothetical protein
MKKLGFIHDMMDVKVLILYTTARTAYPLTIQELYELCYQDDCLSYFDVCTAVPELVQTGHLQTLPEDRYEITEKGRQNVELTADSIAFTVKQRVENDNLQEGRNFARSVERLPRFDAMDTVKIHNDNMTARETAEYIKNIITE